jgi:phosphoserine phosphatase
MRGELDFDESLRKRVGLLKGAPLSIIDTVQNRYYQNNCNLESHLIMALKSYVVF